MSISEISIRRPVFAWMLMAGLIVLGGICFMRMGISQLPDVDFPVVSVNIRLEGAAPEVIETEIVDILEDAIMGIAGVRTVTSQSENSEGTVTAEFNLDRNVDIVVQDVQAKLSQIQPRLPVNSKPATVSKVNPEDQPIVLLTLDSDKYPLWYLMNYVNDRLKDQFSMVSGVGDITLGGYIDPNMRIWLSEKKLNALDLTITDAINLIHNEHSESPAGQVDSGDRQLFIRTMGEATSVEEFEKMALIQRGGQPNYTPIPLKAFARVEEGLADRTRISRANGISGVNLSILKQRGANAVEVAKGVRAKITEIQKGLPEGLHLAVNFDSTGYIEDAVRELNFTLLLSALLTALVCWLFLGSIASTINVVMSIPTSIVGTFIVLYFSGFTLNTFTLLGLSLAIGIVVDDAIMVLENIVRHREMGKSQLDAALIGSKEITFAAIAASISILAIFLPVAFMSGVIGKFFFQFGVTISVAVMLSLLEALTLTPMRCSQFIDTSSERTTKIGRWIEWFLAKLMHGYETSLEFALQKRWLVLFASCIFFATSMLLLTLLKKEFLPSEDQSRYLIRLKTPIESSLSHSDQSFQEVEKFLAARSEIDRYVLQVGGGSPGDASKGSILVTMKPKGKRGVDKDAGHELSQQEMIALSRKKLKEIKGIKVAIQDLSTKSFVASRGFPIEFAVQGPDWNALEKYTNKITDEMEKSGLMTDLDTDYLVGIPELRVIPDRDKAAARGVSISSIDQTINSMIDGIVVGTYPKNGHRYDIRVKLEEDKNQAPAERIQHLFVRNNYGQRVPLHELVRVEEKSSMVTINRRDRERAITVSANVKTGESQEKALNVIQKIAKQVLPPEYHIELSGSSQTFNEAFESLLFALCLGLFVAYMVLASQFNSFKDPLSVLIALPFSVSGAFVGLLATGRSINIYSMIGLILLMGIVKKNSILLIDFTKQVHETEGGSVLKALRKACPIRLRPILMTSIATIVGALPAALSLGPGSESRIPMAVAIIGGVFFSTFLTLYVVPCFHSVLYRSTKA